MYFLRKAGFLPIFILANIPFIIGFTPVIAIYFNTGIYDIYDIRSTVIVISIYSVIIGLIYLFFNSKKEYLLVSNDSLKVKCDNLGRQEVELSINDIIQIDFYRMTSFSSWLSIIGCVSPNSVFISFIESNETVIKHIGYLKYKDVKKIANEKNIKLVLH